jgi:hypothetical protein
LTLERRPWQVRRLNILPRADFEPIAVRNDSLVNVILEHLSEMMTLITDKLFFQQGG